MKKLDTINIIIYIFLSFSLLLGFFINEDLSGGGSQTDFKNTWPYVLGLKSNLISYYQNWSHIHLPFHYVILSYLSKLLGGPPEIIRFIFCIAGILVPILFYKNLLLKYKDIDKNNLFLFACILLIFPTFRYTVIWANAQITAQIFFLISIFFFLKLSENNKTKIDIYLFLQILFLSLACYTRQDYAIYFLFFMFLLLKRLDLKDFFKISIAIIVMSIPGVFFVIEQTSVTNIKFTYKFQNFLLVNSSIISLYLIPLFFINNIYKKNIFKINKAIKKFILIFLTSLFFVSILSFNFDYNYKLGGGFILKTSLFLFGSKIPFFISSALGFTLIYYLSKKNIYNFIFFLLLIFGYSADIVYQKYFEPIFLISFFLVLNNNLTKEILRSKKNIYALYIYFFFYFVSAYLNQIFSLARQII